MRRILIASAALLAAIFATQTASAGDPYWPAGPPRPSAPDACGPGFYCNGVCGMCYGPSYCLRPCWEPFNGLLPAPKTVLPEFQQAVPGYGMPVSHPAHPMYPQYAAHMATLGIRVPPPQGHGAHGGPGGPGAPGSPLFPTHPFARSPRDYFMLED